MGNPLTTHVILISQYRTDLVVTRRACVGDPMDDPWMGYGHEPAATSRSAHGRPTHHTQLANMSSDEILDLSL